MCMDYMISPKLTAGIDSSCGRTFYSKNRCLAIGTTLLRTRRMTSQHLLHISHLAVMATVMHPTQVMVCLMTRITRPVTAMVIYLERRTLMQRIQGYRIFATLSYSWEKRHIPSWYCFRVSCLLLQMVIQFYS